MKINFIDLQAQYHVYKHEIDAAIQEVLDSAAFIMGPQVKALEEGLQQYTASPFAIACASGTDGLLLLLLALNIKPGDEVITTPFTFISTGTMIKLLGAKPVFVDIQEDSYNIDPAKIAEKITAKTRVIMPVSLYGQPADMDEINAIAAAQKQRIYVIEDAAQSFGAEYKGKKSCYLSELAYTSFFPSKPLGCYGDGGAVFANEDELVEKIRCLRVHGQIKRYEHQYLGINGRLDTIQAAILQVKLKYLDQEIKQRESIAARYKESLDTKYFITPSSKKDRTSVYGQYSVRTKQRTKVLEYLKQNNIPTAVHYPKPLHLQPCFADLGYKAGDFPIAEKISQEIFSLPMSAFLTEEQQNYVIESLHAAFGVAV